MVAPGAALAGSSVLVTDRSGAAVTGVGSVSVLLTGVGSGPLVPSSATDAAFEIVLTPAGSGDTTVTAKAALADDRAFRSPTGSVHVPPVQVHPGEDAAGSNEVSAGTVSVST